MNQLFQKMTQSRSMTAIGFMAEDELARATPIDEELLQRILEATSLDEAHALAHEALGQHEMAHTIRADRARRQARAKRDYESNLLLGIV